MIHAIDTITHQLTSPQIARELLDAFENGAHCVHIVGLPKDMYGFPQLIRNAISRIYREKKVPTSARLGIRVSEQFPYSFHDDRRGKFMAISVTPYRSGTRVMLAAIEFDLEGFSL